MSMNLFGVLCLCSFHWLSVVFPSSLVTTHFDPFTEQCITQLNFVYTIASRAEPAPPRTTRVSAHTPSESESGHGTAVHVPYRYFSPRTLNECNSQGSRCCDSAALACSRCFVKHCMRITSA
uniref:Secreted protein n=1 Tax=Rhipicephalus appendiculatus TaxID=34631 RepID=A0A131YE95_RHIAP